MTVLVPGHRLLRSFADGSTLAFGPGRFDNWCVYLTRPCQQPDPPRDIGYFARLKAIAARHGPQLFYTDFLTIYHRTTADISPAILELCYWLSRHYGDDAIEVDIVDPRIGLWRSLRDQATRLLTRYTGRRTISFTKESSARHVLTPGIIPVARFRH